MRRWMSAKRKADVTLLNFDVGFGISDIALTHASRTTITSRGWRVAAFLMGGEAMASAKELLERLTIREIVENWALLRDARRWDRFRELWHEEGRMITTWIEGSFEIHQGEPSRLRQRRLLPALPRRHHHRPQAQSRHRSDEADNLISSHD